MPKSIREKTGKRFKKFPFAKWLVWNLKIESEFFFHCMSRTSSVIGWISEDMLLSDGNLYAQEDRLDYDIHRLFPQKMLMKSGDKNKDTKNARR